MSLEQYDSNHSDDCDCHHYRYYFKMYEAFLVVFHERIIAKAFLFDRRQTTGSCLLE